MEFSYFDNLIYIGIIIYNLEIINHEATLIASMVKPALAV